MPESRRSPDTTNAVVFRGHDYNVGVVGSFSHAAGRRLIDQADCIVAFGASLNQRTTTPTGSR